MEILTVQGALKILEVMRRAARSLQDHDFSCATLWRVHFFDLQVNHGISFNP